MADLANITRRLFLSRAPAAVAVGALAAAPALADQPAEYRITAEQAEAIAAWQIADVIKTAATDDFDKWCMALPRGMSSSEAPDQTIRNAWFSAGDAENTARYRMLKLFRAAPAA